MDLSLDHVARAPKQKVFLVSFPSSAWSIERMHTCSHLDVLPNRFYAMPGVSLENDSRQQSAVDGLVRQLFELLGGGQVARLISHAL